MKYFNKVCLYRFFSASSLVIGLFLSSWYREGLFHLGVYPLLSGRKGEAREPFLHLLVFKLNIINMPKQHSWRWHVLNSSTGPELHPRSRTWLILGRFAATFVVGGNAKLQLEVSEIKMYIFSPI